MTSFFIVCTPKIAGRVDSCTPYHVDTEVGRESAIRILYTGEPGWV